MKWNIEIGNEMFGSYEAHNKKKGPNKFIKEQYEAPHQML